MPYIDVSLEDVYDDMSNYDKDQMVEWLEKDRFYALGEDNEFKIENPNIMDMEWVDMMKKLFHSRLQLSLEDEETITKIANKL